MQRLGTWIVGRMAHNHCKQVIFPQYSLGRDTVALLPHLNQLHNSTSGALCGVSVNHTPYTMGYTYLALCPRESIAQRDELFMFMWKKVFSASQCSSSQVQAHCVEVSIHSVYFCLIFDNNFISILDCLFLGANAVVVVVVVVVVLQIELRTLYILGKHFFTEL